MTTIPCTSAPVDVPESAWRDLAAQLSGELDRSRLAQWIYSQDASPYQEFPVGVAYPRDASDLALLVRFAREYRVPLIPRGGGTSLAGQCVGRGLVVDVSRHMNKILRIDGEAGEAVVEPGVVQDDLNDAATPYGLCFAPDTSTSRQATIGGMIGNNSCGAYSIKYGTTRDHVRRLDVVLTDGTCTVLGEVSSAELQRLREQPGFEGRLYAGIADCIGQHRRAILRDFPKPTVTRRNMGYALDELARRQPWEPQGPPFSLVPLICGSEGTLALVAAATVRLVPRPGGRALVCAHFADLDEAARAVPAILAHGPAAVELMDGALLEATRHNREQARNRFWLIGAPAAVLAIEFYAEDAQRALGMAESLAQYLQGRKLGYAWPILRDADIPRVWALRKAGLGILTGIPGDAKPVTAIEDTAVAVEDLPDYLRDVRALLDRHGCGCVFYGHAGAGVIHLRPMLNLKDPADFERFRALLEETTELVRRYRGSLSGEHGDGRLRSAYLKRMFSGEVYDAFRHVKGLFDPLNLLNPGKIVDPVSPFDALRTSPHTVSVEPCTAFDWSRTCGYVRAVEACNGAGFCRQGPGRGGMCPSYMATRDEADTPRARANVLRILLTRPEGPVPWRAPELWRVLDTCVSCKACATECPSSVDIARIKAEAQHQRHRLERASLRDLLFAWYAVGVRLAQVAPGLATRIANVRWFKERLGIAPQRTLPAFPRETFADWWRRRGPRPAATIRGEVTLWVDEFIDLLEPEVGIAALEVMEALGWRVHAVVRVNSARPLISKGFLDKARAELSRTVQRLEPFARAGMAIVGLEPSALLGLRDEAPDLVPKELREVAKLVQAQSLLWPEWIASLRADGRLDGVEWRPLTSSEMLVHVHCHQKALGSPGALRETLALIPGLRVSELPTACCGMAGVFGYEREHYALSMQMGELILFPAIRARPEAIVCADGFSCRHQIRDGTGRAARHSAQWLRAALATP